jgi:hypothetical protein
VGLYISRIREVECIVQIATTTYELSYLNIYKLIKNITRYS